MNRSHCSAFGFVIAVLASSAATRPAAAQEPPPKDEVVADQLFLEATRALKEGRTEVAYEKLTLAWQQKKSMDIAANLALLERERGDKVNAAQHLDYAIRNFPPTGDPSIKSRMQADLTRLEADVCRIRIVAPPGTALRIDGREVELAYAGSPVYVEPGKRRFDGLHAELGKGTQTIEAQAGLGEIVVKLELEAPPDKRATSHGAANPTKRPEKLPLWPGIVGVAIGGVALGAGVGLIAASQSQASSAEDSGRNLDCDPSSLSSACTELADTLQLRNTLGNASIGMFVAAGVGIAFGTTWLLLPRSGRSPTAIRLNPVVSPNTAGLWLDSSF